jgi:hypothetical protein
MLKIIYASSLVASVELNGKVYFIRLDEKMPEIFNESGIRLTISNADSFINYETANLYNYRDVVHAGKYWYAGYNTNYINEHFDDFLEHVILKTKTEIFTSNLASEYASEFWIECTPKDKISEKLLNPLMKKSGDLLNRYGYKMISDFLNRIRKVVQEKHDMSRVERIMKNLDVKEVDIDYPRTENTDHRLLLKMKSEINKESTIDKIPKSLKRTLKECESQIL